MKPTAIEQTCCRKEGEMSLSEAAVLRMLRVLSRAQDINTPQRTLNKVNPPVSRLQTSSSFPNTIALLTNVSLLLQCSFD